MAQGSDLGQKWNWKLTWEASPRRRVRPMGNSGEGTGLVVDSWFGRISTSMRPSWWQKRRRREVGESCPHEGGPGRLGGEASAAGAWTRGRGSWPGDRRAHLGRGGACGGVNGLVPWLESLGDGAAPTEEVGGGGVSALRALPTANGSPRMGNP
jgi:hypothetical protein